MKYIECSCCKRGYWDFSSDIKFKRPDNKLKKLQKEYEKISTRINKILESYDDYIVGKDEEEFWNVTWVSLIDRQSSLYDEMVTYRQRYYSDCFRI
jgi:hypothetical protein